MREAKVNWSLETRSVTRAVWFLFAAAGLAACATPIVKSTLTGPPPTDQLAELWIRPERGRDLFHGVGGARFAPDPTVVYTVADIKRSGFSRGYTVKDPHDREWSAKFPPEAQTEIAASRILWGVGYHQPPIYYLATWTAAHAPSPNPQLPARFREKAPDIHGLDAKEPWSYYHNPFVGTREMNGLLVLQAMLGNSDLKDQQNVIYELKEPFEGSRRWYVAGIWDSRSDGPASSMHHEAIRLSSSRPPSSPESWVGRFNSTIAAATASCSRTSRRQMSVGSVSSSGG